MNRSLPVVLAGVLASLLLSGCGAPTPPAPAAPAAPEVGVLVVAPTDVAAAAEHVGRLSATRSAEVRARVAGIVQERVYTEGTDVAAGEVLFRIDPAELDATLRNRRAALAQARANAENARQKAERYRELAGRGVIASQELDDAVASHNSLAAAVKQVEADVEQARLDLSYATVTAPISGRAGAAMVTEGALVGQGTATLLTTIEQIDPLYVNFSQTQAEFERYRSGQDASDTARVQLRLRDGSLHPHVGTLSFADLAVDPATGAIALRATLANPEGRLLPGMFVDVLLERGVQQGVYRVPQAAVQRDAAGPYALVVDGAGQVARRGLTLSGVAGTDWVVREGLNAGEQVVVSGLQKARPGSTVKPVPLPAAVPAADPPASAPAQP